MRVAYVLTDRGIPLFGTKGASVHVREFIRALAETDVIDLFCTQPGDGNNPLPVRTVHVVPKPVLESSDPNMERDLQRLATVEQMKAQLHEAFARDPYDAIYERYSLFSDAGLEVARTYRVPFLLEVNAPLIQERGRVEALPLAGAAYEIEQTVFRNADAILAVSEEMAAYVQAVGASSERVHVVPNGVNTSHFRPGAPDTEARGSLGLDGNFVVGFVGSLKAWHGVAILIDAYAAAARPTWRLLIVGDGPERARLEARVASLHCRDGIIFTGALPHEDVPRCVAAMDIAVAPYRYLDEFYFSPLKLFEYLAGGRAVIASDIGQIATVIRHGDNGYLVPPDDVDALSAALVLLSEDHRLRDSLARRAPEHLVTWRETAGRARAIAEAVRGEQAAL